MRTATERLKTRLTYWLAWMVVAGVLLVGVLAIAAVIYGLKAACYYGPARLVVGEDPVARAVFCRP